MPSMSPPRPRALLVAWMFPPHGNIGAKRPYRFARHLPGCGWDVTVLCGRRPPEHEHDPSPWPLPESVRVVRDYDAGWLTAPLLGLYEGLRRVTSAPHPAPGAHPALRRSPAARAFGAVEQLVWNTVPTEVVAIHVPHAVRVARRLVAAERPAVVWTTSYPFSAHLVGVALRRAAGVPFVADLRDPWTLNFTFARKTAPARWLESRLEALVFARAARVVVTTETLADAYRDLYPRHAAKFVAVPNAFDTLDLPPRAVPDGPVRLVHFGHVYGGARTMAGVYEALAGLRARGGFPPGGVVLENYGRLSDDDRALADAFGLGDVVRVLDPVPYVEGLARLRSAHLLLLPAWGTDRGPLFLPGKLYDYLLAGAPILALGENPELAGILERTRAGRLLGETAVGEIAAAIAEAIAGRWRHDPDAAAVAEFSAERSAGRLADVFASVVREAGG